MYLVYGPLEQSQSGVPAVLVPMLDLQYVAIAETPHGEHGSDAVSKGRWWLLSL